MPTYDSVNTTDDTENGISRDDEQQHMLSVSTSMPIWPNSTSPTCIVSNSKIGDMTPTTPGTYYATIHSTCSSRRYNIITVSN